MSAKSTNYASRSAKINCQNSVEKKKSQKFPKLYYHERTVNIFLVAGTPNGIVCVFSFTALTSFCPFAFTRNRWNLSGSEKLNIYNRDLEMKTTRRRYDFKLSYLTWPQDDKTTNVWKTCFRHYNILANIKLAPGWKQLLRFPANSDGPVVNARVWTILLSRPCRRLRLRI